MYISNKILSDILRNCLKICINNEKLINTDLTFADKCLILDNDKLVNNIYDSIFDCYWNEYYQDKKSKNTKKRGS